MCSLLFSSAFIQSEIKKEESHKKDGDDDEPINGEANVAKEKSNRNDEKEYDDDGDTGENEADEEEEHLCKIIKMIMNNQIHRKLQLKRMLLMTMMMCKVILFL